MRALSVGEPPERDPLLRALSAAGCVPGRISMHEVPAVREPYFYLGNFFEQIKRPLQLAAIRRALARDAAPYVWWNRDAPWNCAIKPWRRLLVRSARAADIHLAHSLQSAQLFGEPVRYFPNAVDTDRYALGTRSLESLRSPQGYRYPVSFVGTVNPGFKMVRERIQFLTALRERLRREAVQLYIFDTSVGSELTAAAQVDIIQTSRVNLNVGAVCDQPVRSWGIPERCFGIASCGGFLLCDQRRHAADTFPADAWSEFADLEQCVERILFYLAHLDQARENAERLHRAVLERHTYTVRARTLLELVSAWRATRASRLDAAR